MKIDIVISYVDPSRDPQWQKDYTELTGVPFRAIRYRSWNTLELQVQGILKYIGWVNKIFILTNSKIMVPDEVAGMPKVEVVDHSSIMPKGMKVFNSCAIEMFMDQIPGLSEHFIYFNDDMYILDYMNPTDFFSEDGEHNYMNFKVDHVFIADWWREQLKDTNVAKYALGIADGNWFFSHDHMPVGYIKRNIDECKESVMDKIMDSIHLTRDKDDLSQSLWMYYQILNGTTEKVARSGEYIQIKEEFAHYIYLRLIESKPLKMICLNDRCETTEEFEECYPYVINGIKQNLNDDHKNRMKVSKKAYKEYHPAFNYFDGLYEKRSN